MKKSRILSAVLSTAMLASCFTGFSASAAPAETAVDNEYAVLSENLSFDFTSMTEVPAYSAETGSGFVDTTTSVASYTVTDDSDTSAGTGRKVSAVSEITLDGGAKVTETDGEFVNSNDYNYGGLAFRVNVEPGMYNVKVEGIDGTSKDNTAIAISGMTASRLTGTGAWDSAGLVAKTGYATWTDNTWSYNYVSGEGFIEVEVEPALKPSADAPQTVGVKSITITPLSYEYPAVYDPTIFILGDSTQKTYTFEENGMSGYGQILGQMFGCRVVNYSMGGRSMKANYQEGRFNDVLAAAKPGDFVFIHSAHNDESTGDSAGPAARFGRGSNEATYKNWLYKVYIPSMKAMGVTPVLVSSMPRMNNGAPREYFTPDSPRLLKEAAEAVDGVEFVDLFTGAIEYLSAIGTEETKAIYMSIEAGETAGKTNSGSYANGHPDNKIDGTHYKEAASKQWSRIIVEDIYAQKDSSSKMGALTELLKDNVKAACEDGNWTEHVFPEMANDVSTIGNTSADAKSQGDNAYYRNQIEKVLQLGVMTKDAEGNFYPQKDMTVGGFADALTKLWDLDEATLSAYTSVLGEVEPTPYETPEPTPPGYEYQGLIVRAQYDADGRLVSVVLSGSEAPEKAALSEENAELLWTMAPLEAKPGEKIFFWESLDSMKPTNRQPIIGAPLTEAASLSEAVTGGDYLAVSEKYAEGDTITAGDVMMDTANVTITACGDTTAVKTGGGSFTSGLCFQLRLDKDYTGDPAAVVGKAGSIGLLVTPKVDGRLYVEAKVGSGKTMKVTDGSNTMGEYVNDTDASQFPTIEADLKAGVTYCVFERGGTGEVYGVRFLDAASVPTPAPTPTVDPNATPEPELVDYTPISADAALTREAMAAIIYDAYEAKFGKAADGTWNKPAYMTNYNGTTITPDSPEYDPNLTGKEAQYYPLVGWGVITDKEAIAAPLYAKVKEVYNLGLMRSEAGIARGSMKNGTEMEPAVIVTRAKAAKELYFLYNLIQPVKGENQTLPGDNMAFTVTGELVTPNYERPRFPGGNEVEPTPVPTPSPTPRPAGTLPDDILWRADDSAFNGAFVVSEPTTVDGLTIYPNWTEKARTVEYTHVDGTTYEFTRGWCGGSGSTTSRALSFVPEEACTVTVVFDGNGSAGRTMNIAQAGTVIESKNSETGATVLTADIEDPSKGAVYVYGGGSNKNIYAIFVEYYDPDAIVYRKLSGNISYTGSIDMTGKNVVFTNTETGEATKVAYGQAYSVDLIQRSTYDITVEGLEEQVCASLDTKQVYIAKADKTFDIELLEIVDTPVKGEIVSHGLDMTGVTVTFTAQDDPTIVETATISAASADKEMPEAEYELTVTLTPNHVYDITTSDVTGWTMSELSKTYTMAAGDTAPFKNLLFTKDVVATEWKDTVTVGADKEFKTITDAVAAIKAMTGRPAGEAGRTAIVVDPGTYCEQVTVNVPYVTLKAADENNRPTLTWYYGIGYTYYSANNGYYSEQHYVERTARSTATRWGCTLRVASTGFLAENIIFENSFNCRVVADEIADGVWPEVDPADGGKPDRTVEGFDAMTTTAVERAAAFAGDAANYECYRCDFISSQDTLYTGYNGYFKECYIEGGTDFIFGGNSILFEKCTLAWHGYTGTAKGGYLTACQTSSASNGTANLATNGYLFRDCTVTNSKYYPNNSFAGGGWGRNWGGAKCQVVFLNTTLETDVPTEWVKMGGNLEDSILYVEGVTDKDGKAVDTSGTRFNPNGTMAANGYTVMADTDYFGSWIPKHYEGELPDPTAKPEGVSVDLTNLDGGTIFTADEVANKTQVTFGLDENGTRVAADSADAVIIFVNAKYHSNEHGINVGEIQVPVTGASEIKMGTCAWGSNVTVTNSAGATVAEFTTNNGTCYHNNTVDNVVTAYYTANEATTLTIKGGSYIPFVSVMKIAAEDIPNEATITYALGESGAAGEVPAAEKIIIGAEATIPLNRTLYKEGYTLTAWTDGTNTYAPGTKVALTENVTVTPIFTANTAKLGDAETTVAFDFQKKNGTPVIGYQNKTAILVYQATIGSAVIDVKLDVDTTSGKLANGNWDDWAQVNGGTIFTAPAIDGCIVTMDTIYADAEYTICGTAYTQAGQTQGSPVTIDGEDAIVIVAGANSGSYWRGFSVTYPQVGGGSSTDSTPVPTDEPSESATVGYAEYIFDATNNTAFDASNTTAVITNNSDPALTVVPTLNMDPDSINAGKTYRLVEFATDGWSPYTEYTAELPISKASHTWTGMLIPSNGRGFILDTNLAENGADYCNVYVMYRSREPEKNVWAKLYDYVDGADSAEYQESTSVGQDTAIAEFKNVTADQTHIRVGGDVQGWIFYIGVEYVKAAAAPEATPDPHDYGTATVNEVDGSVTLNFGSESIISAGGGYMIDDTTLGISRPDNLKADAVLSFPAVDLSKTNYNRIDLIVASSNSAKVTVMVGDTVVATFADVKNGSWTDYAVHSANLEDVTASGYVTLNIEGSGYCGNYAYVKLYNGEVIQEATVTYAAGEGVEGTAPTAAKYTKGEEITLPVNRTLYVEGKTLTGWSDGTTTYAPGAAYTVNEDVTLTAVFEDNAAALGDVETTVSYSFRQDEGTPVLGIQGNTGFIVYQAVMGDVSIDVKMDIDATAGKFANANWNDWAQVNGGTKFIVPVIEGSVVTMGDLYGDDGTYTINGVAKTGDNGTETMTAAGTVEIVAGEQSGSYWRGFTVTYPAIAE